MTDTMREAGLTFTPVTITSGGNQSRGDNGYWSVAKLVLLSELAAYLESGRLRIVQSEMGRALIAELQAFEVEFPAAGNMTVDVRRQEHHGDLVIATALALWHAVSRPSGAIGVGRLAGWY